MDSDEYNPTIQQPVSNPLPLDIRYCTTYIATDGIGRRGIFIPTRKQATGIYKVNYRLFGPIIPQR